MSNTQYPKIVEFLRNAINRKDGVDSELAFELAKLIDETSRLASENDMLRAENEAVYTALQFYKALQADRGLVEEITQNDSEYPKFPDDFYVYGEDVGTHSPSDEEIQEMINELYDVELEDGQFVEQSIGDTLVIKTKYDGVEEIFVARGFASFIVPEDEDNGCESPDCTFPDCDCMDEGIRF